MVIMIVMVNCKAVAMKTNKHQTEVTPSDGKMDRNIKLVANV